MKQYHLWLIGILIFDIFLGLLTDSPDKVFATQNFAFLRNPAWNTFSRTQSFSSGHPAIDFATGTGPVVAAGDGIISAVNFNPPRVCGSNISFNGPRELEFRINHENGYGTGYLHLGAFGTNPRTDQRWKVGDRIFAGEEIGSSGNTGCATGPHLHFWVFGANGNVNPDVTNLWAITYPDQGWIDTPAQNTTVTAMATFRGWARVTKAIQSDGYRDASGGAIARVEIWLFDLRSQQPTFLGNAFYGEYRPDLGGPYGWSFLWDATRFAPGTYLIQARAVSSREGTSVLQGSLRITSRRGMASDTWYLRDSSPSGAAAIVFHYGNQGDIPVVGDWNGDGIDTPGVVRDGHWYLRNSNTTGVSDIDFLYGNQGDIPVVGDWNGDGVDTPGVVRDGRWYLRNSNTSGVADVDFLYGSPGNIPIVGDWDGDRTDTPGVVHNDHWYLRNSNTGGVSDIDFLYGNPGAIPLSGAWFTPGKSLPGVIQ